MDLALERYGDPHVGFLVLVSPDAPPRVVAITPRGHHDFAQVRMAPAPPPPTLPAQGARFFTRGDLTDAAMALSDAGAATRPPPGHRGDDWRLSDSIEDMWELRRTMAMERQVKQTAHALRYDAECPYCHSHYTTRGLPLHLAKSLYCSRRAAEERGAEERAGAPEDAGT